jgi:hypothetical protein
MSDNPSYHLYHTFACFAHFLSTPAVSTILLISSLVVFLLSVILSLTALHHPATSILQRKLALMGLALFARQSPFFLRFSKNIATHLTRECPPTINA